MKGVLLAAASVSLVAGLGLAGTSRAATLGSAELTLTIGILPPAVFPGPGAAGLASAPNAVTLAAGSAFAGTRTVPIGPGFPTAVRLVLSRNDPGSFAGNPLRGSMAVRGSAALLGLGGSEFVNLPIAVGAFFHTATTFLGYTAGFSYTIAVVGQRWTAGRAVVSGLSPYTGFVTRVTRTGTNGLSPNGVGPLTLVAPVRIQGNLTGTIAAFGELKLTFVPEPGTGLLLGWGAACLAAFARRQRRS